MSKTNAFETDFADFIFNNADLTGIGSGLQGSGTAGNLYVALFTVAPTESTSGTECDYTNYARVAVSRDASGWTITGNTTDNQAAIQFPTAGTGDDDIAVAVGIMGDAGSSSLLYYGSLDSSLTVSNGVTPQFDAGDLDIVEN